MQTTLAQVQQNGDAHQVATTDIVAGFGSLQGFQCLQRIGQMFAQSDLVPAQFRNNLPNTVIAVDMAMRLGSNPLLVMQNIYVVQGRPAWSAQFLIATFNASGRYSSIRYAFQGQPGSDDWGCRAVATELKTGDRLEGPLITIRLAKQNGWFGKSGSKWQTMPEQMLRYRAAAWFIRTIAPEIALGLQTVDEVRDTVDLEQVENGAYEPEPVQQGATMADVQAHVQAKPATTPNGRRVKPADYAQAAQEEPAPAQAPAPEHMEEPQPAAPAVGGAVRDDLEFEQLVDLFYQQCKDAKLAVSHMVFCYQKTVKNVHPDDAKAAMAYDPAVFNRTASLVRGNPAKWEPVS